MLAGDDTQNDRKKMAEAAGATEQDWLDIHATLQGDGGSYERLISRHQRSIATYLWRFTRNRQQWEELLQDTFVEAYLSLGSYAGRAPLEHWLKKIATRVGYRFWKQRSRQQRETRMTSETDQLAATTSEPTSAYEAAEIVHRLLDQLAPRDRLVMTLAYLEERSVAEIAEITNWSVSRVKVQTFRARKRLAKICRQQGIEL